MAKHTHAHDSEPEEDTVESAPDEDGAETTEPDVDTDEPKEPDAEPADNQKPDSAEPESPVSDDPAETKRRGLGAAWAWLKAKPVRMVVAVVLALLVIAGNVLAFTDLKYTVLGTFVKSSAEITVTDAETKQPVPKALVDFAGVSEVTDKDGRVKLAGAKPGHSTVKVRKTGYADAATPATVPLFSPAKVTVSLKPNGIKVVTVVTNTITGASVEGAEVKNGEASALTDSEGRAELSLPPSTNNTKQTLKLTSDGYNPTEVTVQVGPRTEPVAAKMVPTGKAYFLSNRTGRLDLYASNLDGSGAEVILPGTGNEDSATGILLNINNAQNMAIVSSREGRRVAGNLQHDLFIFNAESRKLTKIDQNVDFGNYRAWLGDTLLYSKPNSEANYVYCTDIKTYNLGTGKSATAFAAKYEDAGCATIVLALKDSYLYSVRQANEAGRIGIFSAKLGSAAKRISPTYSDHTVRRAKQTLLSEYYNYNSGSNPEVWDSIDLANLAVSRLPNGPAFEFNRYYNDSPDNNASVFIEERDGKSELYITDGSGGNEKKLTSMGSVNQFVQWYGDEYIVFSSTKPDENALYVVSKGGGTPVKIADFYRGNQRTYGGGGNPYN